MKNTTRILLLAASVFVTGTALAQPAATPAAGRGAGDGRASIVWPPGYIEPGLPQPPYVSAETPQGTGPHPAIMATLPGAEKFVAYFPADLNALGNKKMPVMLWANGSCTYVGNKFRHFLTQIASHDYFVLAGGPMSAPDNGKAETITIASNNPITNPEAPRVPTPPPAPGAPVRALVTHELLSQGIDWAIAENNRQGSKFYHKLDTKNIVVSGQSCGGSLTSTFASDKRVKTLMMWSGGTLKQPEGEINDLLNKPAMLITGDPRYDVAFWSGIKLYENIKKTPLFYAWRTNMTHLGTYRQTDGGELAPIAIAWMDWQLKGDKTASKMFVGDNCTLCTNEHYHVQKRHI